VILVEKNTLGRSGEIARVSCHGCSGLRAGQRTRWRGDTLANRPLDRLLIRLDRRWRRRGSLVGHAPHHMGRTGGFEPAATGAVTVGLEEERACLDLFAAAAAWVTQARFEPAIGTSMIVGLLVLLHTARFRTACGTTP
jgi:hypothetical protein